MTHDAPTPLRSAPLPRAAKWACAGVAAVTFLVFLPSLSNGWVMWDDDMNFLNNPSYRGLSPRNLIWMFTTFHGGPYQPLSWITLAIDYLAWGEHKPQGYHFTNVLLHAINAGLFTWVAARLFISRRIAGGLSEPRAQEIVSTAEPPTDRPSGMTPSLALDTPKNAAIAFGVLVGLFWAVHPLRVEAVSWITERREVLCGLFSLAALGCHLAGRRRIVVFAWALAAMLAKGSAVVLPGLLVLIDLHRDAPAGRAELVGILWRSLRRHAGVFAMTIAISVLAVIGQRDAAAIVPLEHAPLGARVDILSNGLTYYAIKTAWPVGLAPLYEAPPVLGTLRPAGHASRAALLAALVTAYALRRRAPALLPLLAAYVAMVLPVGGLVQVGSQIAADRYAYQPGWALSLLAGVTAWSVIGAIRSHAARLTASLALAAIACMLLTPPCRRLQHIWHDTTALWTHELAVFPETAIAHYNIGIAATNAQPGRAADAFAEPHFRRALARLPHYSQAHRDLAELLARSGRSDEAIEHFRLALKWSPRYELARLGLANLLWSLNRHDQAIDELRRMVELSAEPQTPRCILARALAADGRTADAIAEYERLLAGAPDDVDALLELSRVLSSSPLSRHRNGARAVELAERARKRSPHLTQITAETLAAAYAETGDFTRAVAVLQQIATGLPGDKLSRLDAMIEHFRAGRPLRVAPKYP